MLPAQSSDSRTSHFICCPVKSRKSDQLWTGLLKIWFLKGKDDPAISLVHLTTQVGAYEDQPGSQMGKLFEMAKGELTGEAGKTGRNENFGDGPPYV